MMLDLANSEFKVHERDIADAHIMHLEILTAMEKKQHEVEAALSVN